MRLFLTTIGLVSLFTFGLISLTASADTITQDPETELALSREFKAARIDLQEAKQFFRDASFNWEKSHTAYQDDPSETNLTKAKTYAAQLIKQVIDVLDKHYALLSARLSLTAGLPEAEKTGLLSEIEAEQTWLQTQRVAIAEASNEQQIAAIAQTLNDYRTEKNAFLKRVIGLLASTRVKKTILQLTDASTRVEDSIAVLKELKKDVSALESVKNQLSAGLGPVSDKYQQAHDGFAAISNAATADQDFEASLKILREAGEKLNELSSPYNQLIAELKKIKASKVGGNGTLLVKGQGTVIISVDGTIVIKPEKDVSFSVFDRAGDLSVQTQGDVAVTTENRKKTYTGFSEATATGTDFLLVSTGTVVELVAEGKGRAYLDGAGTFQSVPDGTPESFEVTNGVVFNVTK